MRDFWRTHGAGLLLTAALAAACTALARLPALQQAGIGVLTVAMVAGMVLGNTVFARVAAQTGAGVDFARTRLLRLGVVFYGWRITFAQIVQVGWAGLLLDVLMMAATFALAWQMGRRLGVDEDTTILIGTGASVCGAAAVMGAEPVVKANAHKTAVAVATVVVFGTVAMFAYPLAYAFLGMDEYAYGLYVGATVHEVAQVVVAGQAVGETAAVVAVIEKMLRVLLLAPFLLLLGAWLARRRPHTHGGGQKWVLPWFVLGFAAVAGINSLGVLPQTWVDYLVEADLFVLAMAMSALGLRTQAAAVRQAGAKPLLLAAVLALFLAAGGYVLNTAVLVLFA